MSRFLNSILFRRHNREEFQDYYDVHVTVSYENPINENFVHDLKKAFKDTIPTFGMNRISNQLSFITSSDFIEGIPEVIAEYQPFFTSLSFHITN